LLGGLLGVLAIIRIELRCLAKSDTSADIALAKITTPKSLTTLCSSVTSFPPVKKCCDGRFDPKSAECQQLRNGLNAANFKLESFEENILNIGQTSPEVSIGFPSCKKSGLKVLKLDENSTFNISDGGHLVSVISRQFETSLDLGDFCIDVDDESSVNVAVVCDPCSVGKRLCVR
jgi:hypothetical protein